ncbi:hypothetical protein HYR99_27675 [Candidatus Poribacteria bacterium]|nr:hypothetical protein [Candidatus Poribacteria bacterium]
MERNEKQRGPRTHRVLIFGFSFLLTLLLIWLLRFILSDIGRLPGPNYDDIERKYVEQGLMVQLETLRKEHQSIATQIDAQREIQNILRTSMDNSKQTMEQLLEMHRLKLERNIKPTEVEQTSLAESEALFLANQKKFQEANEQIAQLSEQQRSLQQQSEELSTQIADKRNPARDEYQRLSNKHSLKVASLKLAFLIPMLLVAAWFVIKKRGRAYAPFIYSTFIATFWTTGVVMHEYFPREFFKYIAIGVSIAVVIAFLIHLIRMVAAPKKEWLLKQYKEAYNKRLCPVCAYPIHRGPYKYMTWTSKGPKGIMPVLQGGEGEGEQPYACPSCGERLYEKCDKCGKIRHSLLPYCESCGDEKQPLDRG